MLARADALRWRAPCEGAVVFTNGVFDPLHDEDKPADLVAARQPDVLVKGGDYRPDDNVVGGDVVRARGGRVVIIPFSTGHSSTATIARVRADR
jgi:D-beta-D-heptose 7-phosphate kinase / D-beta-D-heptose 1-phosphate adenosyltransferase